MLFLNTGHHATRYHARRSISESIEDVELESLIGDEEDTIKETLNGMDHSKKLNIQLNEASDMMLQLTESLDTEFSKDMFCKNTANKSKRQAGKDKLAKKKSLSNSEPGIVKGGPSRDTFVGTLKHPRNKDTLFRTDSIKAPLYL